MSETTRIARAYPDRVEVRGRDLARDLMGRLTFTEHFHLLLTGREPTQEQRFFLDLLLVAIAEHGLMPTNVAARMTYAADPDSLQGAVAAGILGCGSVILGSAENAGRFLVAVRARADGRDLAAAARALVEQYRADRKPIPGYGHPLHRAGDPRAARLLALAEEVGRSGPHVAAARAAERAIAELMAKSLVLNVSGAIAAVLLDVGKPGCLI